MSARPRSALRNRVEYFIAAFVIATLRWSPKPLAEMLGAFYAHLLDVAIPRLRRIAIRNLQLAMPELNDARRQQITDGVFRSIGRVLLAFARFPDINRKNVAQWISYEGFEHYEEAKRRGRGVLFATAHLGNWELSAFSHALLCEPMNVVVRPLDNPVIDALVEQRRAMSGNRIIEKKDFARTLLKALHDNQPVGILIDQNTGLDQGAFVNFFGTPACSGTAFAKMAAHTGATVIPGFAFWIESERKYHLKFYPPVDISGDAVEDTGRLQAAVERAIREHPDQWLWIHRRWKTRPPGEASLYD